MKLLTFFGVTRKVTTKAHGAVQIVIDTQEEFPPESAALLFATKDLFGSWGFKVGEVPMEAEDVPDYEPEFEDDKSPSKRLRAVLFVYYKQKQIVEPFNLWYSNQIETYINAWKAHLEGE